MSDGHFGSWDRGKKELQRASLRRHGWVNVYSLGRIQYWQDPVSKQTLDDNRAAQVLAMRERSNAAPSGSTGEP